MKNYIEPSPEVKEVLERHRKWLKGEVVGYWTKIERIDFRNLNLQGYDFRQAHLKNSNFSGANLRNADFRGVNLIGAKFDDADIRGANFEGCIGFVSLSKNVLHNPIYDETTIFESIQYPHSQLNRFKEFASEKIEEIRKLQEERQLRISQSIKDMNDPNILNNAICECGHIKREHHIKDGSCWFAGHLCGCKCFKVKK